MDQKLKAWIKAAMEKTGEWKDFFGFLLAVIAIAFAIIQFKDSRDLKDKIKHLLEETSTKYIGSFPYNLDDINGFIDRSHKDLLVLVDFPGYGHYSRPDKFDEYMKNIIKLRQGNPPRKVRMLFYSVAERERKLKQEQFPKTSWEIIRADPRFRIFFGTYHAGLTPPANQDLFIKDLLDLQAQYEKALCNNGVEIEHINQSSAIFFWLEDGESAVFAINNRGGDARELSFRTSDGKLIDSLQSMFNSFWKDNRSDPQGCH